MLGEPFVKEREIDEQEMDKVSSYFVDLTALTLVMFVCCLNAVRFQHKGAIIVYCLVDHTNVCSCTLSNMHMHMHLNVILKLHLHVLHLYDHGSTTVLYRLTSYSVSQPRKRSVNCCVTLCDTRTMYMHRHNIILIYTFKSTACTIAIAITFTCKLLLTLILLIQNSLKTL